MALNVFSPKYHVEEIIEEIRECLQVGWTGLGYKTETFEKAWKEYTRLPYAHFVNSSTAGLHLAINVFKNCYKWDDGDEIITTPLTFVSPNHAILYERLTPVFADIDEYLCLDPKDIEKKITKKTRAVVFVGIGGNTGKLNKVATLCKKHKLKLILDAAHMAGTHNDGKHIGSEADVTVFSFQAVKNLPTADSGMICFKDEEKDSLVRQLSWLGISKNTYQRFNNEESSYKWKYDVPNLGFKYHGNSIMASIGLVQLKYLDEDNRKRNEIAGQYDSLLAEINQVKRIPIAEGCYSSRHLYQIMVEERDKVLTHFYDNEIYPGVHYWDNTYYPMYSHARKTCTNSWTASGKLITLPIHLRLTDQDIARVVEVLKEAVK